LVSRVRVVSSRVVMPASVVKKMSGMAVSSG
jgi:hypothetical protein